jgi:hypothetical protein
MRRGHATLLMGPSYAHLTYLPLARTPGLADIAVI